jgi:hypothetical protein
VQVNWSKIKMRVSKTYMIVWTTLVGIALMTLVALGIRERHSAATLHQLGPAQIDWTAAGGPKGAESLKLPGGLSLGESAQAVRPTAA